MTGAHEVTKSPSALSPAGGLLTWLGGGDRREVGERHERSAHTVAGAIVLLGAGFAWIVASAAVTESVRWPVPAVLPLTLLFGLLVGAVTRATAGAPNRGRSGIAGRAAIAVAVGVVVGELAALVVFSGSIDHRLDERALRNADSTPAVAQASESLRQTKDARAGLDAAVERARDRQDQALVVARCEYHPTPECPQTRITGVPGTGPETRTANELLADAQHELDDALAARDHQAPDLDATIARDQQARTEARAKVVTNAGRGLGARWVAMNEVTLASAGALTLRLATIGSCALLYLLPLILGLWWGKTSHDRRASARAERERAELDADTAIAIKRAEVRREAEIMWAEHQLTQARLAIEAQVEIDRAQQRRRVEETLEDPVRASSRRSEPMEEDMYLPIAAEAEAASRAVAQLPSGAETPDVEPHDERGIPLIASLPDATRAAARWIRPLVPPFVARVIDNTTQPLRTARQVFEEVEEITFSFKRTRKVTVDSESSDVRPQRQSATAKTTSQPGRIASSRGDQPRESGYPESPSYQGDSSMEQTPVKGVGTRSFGAAEREGRLELMEREGPRRLSAPEGPRQLPPAE